MLQPLHNCDIDFLLSDADAIIHISKPHPQIARHQPIVLVVTHQKIVLLVTHPLIVCLDGNPP